MHRSLKQATSRFVEPATISEAHSRLSVVSRTVRELNRTVRERFFEHGRNTAERLRMVDELNAAVAEKKALFRWLDQQRAEHDEVPAPLVTIRRRAPAPPPELEVCGLVDSLPGRCLQLFHRLMRSGIQMTPDEREVVDELKGYVSEQTEYAGVWRATG